MSTSANKYDTIEQLIFDEHIRITAVDIDSVQRLMNVTLNTGVVLHFPVSSFAAFSNASVESLNNYELIGGGLGIHWPILDEDLSLKGFLQQELKRTITNVAA